MVGDALTIHFAPVKFNSYYQSNLFKPNGLNNEHLMPGTAAHVQDLYNAFN